MVVSNVVSNGQVNVLATGLVYRNASPHRRAIHAMHPTIARTGSGQFACAFDLGQGPESFDYGSY